MKQYLYHTLFVRNEIMPSVLALICSSQNACPRILHVDFLSLWYLGPQCWREHINHERNDCPFYLSRALDCELKVWK